MREEEMASDTIVRSMEGIGAGGVYVGTVEEFDGGRIHLARRDRGEGPHKGQKVRLSATAAVTFEEEPSGKLRPLTRR
jgi:hypothetical protein